MTTQWTIWAGLAAAVALPALAQQSGVETQRLEPLIIPGVTQNAEGARSLEPLIVPGATAQQGSRGAEGGPTTVTAPAEGGFGADAEGSGSFIDRAFGIGQQGGVFGSGEQAEEGGIVAIPLEEPESGEGSGDGGLLVPIPDGGEQEAGQTAGDGEVYTSRQVDDLPMFKEAPFSTRNLFGPNQPQALPALNTVSSPGAEIRQLDKMTGQTETVTIKQGEALNLDRLRVELESCRQPARGGTHGTIAYLRIWDPRRSEEKPAFEGWMFAESPALSALDHPRYDVWVLGCTPLRSASQEAEEPKKTAPGEG